MHSYIFTDAFIIFNWHLHIKYVLSFTQNLLLIRLTDHAAIFFNYKVLFCLFSIHRLSFELFKHWFRNILTWSLLAEKEFCMWTTMAFLYILRIHIHKFLCIIIESLSFELMLFRMFCVVLLLFYKLIWALWLRSFCYRNMHIICQTVIFTYYCKASIQMLIGKLSLNIGIAYSSFFESENISLNVKWLDFMRHKGLL